MSGKQSKRYTYAVVTNNGAGVYSEHRRCREARAAMTRHAAAHPRNGPFEIERIQHLDGGGRRYFMRRRSRWVLWSSCEDTDVRNPDWIAP